MDVKIDDPCRGDVIALLEEHLADMYATSPSDSVHALDVDALKSANITFFSGWQGGELQGCVAINHLTPEHIELKSMRTATTARQSGVATKLLEHALNVALEKGYRLVSLETGSQEFFRPARNLYEKFGFRYGRPFADYSENPHSFFMHKQLR